MSARQRWCATLIGGAVMALLLAQTAPAQDPANWSPPQDLPDRGARERPALAAKGETLCMAWRGVFEDDIWVSITREAWTSQRGLADRGTRNSPVLCALGENFVMGWRGVNEDNFWVATSRDGLNWSPQQELRDRGSREGLALAGAGGLAVMAWRGVFEDNIWVSTSQDGLNWSPQRELQDIQTTTCPALAAGGSPRKFVLACRGADPGRIRVASSEDGLNWSPPRELTDRTTTSPPAVAYSEGLKTWYMAWRGNDQGGIWVSSSKDGLDWSPGQQVPGAASQDGPALAATATMVDMIGRGAAQNLLWTTVLAPGAGAGDLLAREIVPARAGAWTKPLIPKGQETNWMQAVHVAVLPNGKVLMANGSSNRNRLDQNGQFQEGVDVYDYDVVNNTSLFDPETLAFERIGSPPATRTVEGDDHPNDLFCCHHVHLWDGNVLFVSGTAAYYPNGDFRGNRLANIYDWKAGQWREGGVMEDGHWYPTLLRLPDGRIAVFSGFTLTENKNSKLVEFYDPSKPTDEAWSSINIDRLPNSPFFTQVGGDTNWFDDLDLYPRILPLPDGRFVITGHGSGAGAVGSRHSYFMTIPPVEDDSAPQITFTPGPDRPEGKRTYAAAINDPNAPSEILVIGGQRGSDNINHGPNAQGVWGAEVTPILERLRPTPGGNWTWDFLYNFLGDGPTDVRIMHDAVILPTKQVLVVGGGNYSYYRPALHPVLLTRDPGAPGGYRTQVMNPSVIARLYHTSSVLLPDGRVFLGGGNARRATRDSRNGRVYLDNYAPGVPPEPTIPAESWEVEVFSPPYLFLPGPRPEITDAPKSLNYGEEAGVTVANATAGGSLVLIRLPSTTHGMDLGQQLIDLPLAAPPTDAGLVRFTAPERSNIAAPGYYMLFYVNASGKPSKAAIIQLGANEGGLLTAAVVAKKK